MFPIHTKLLRKEAKLPVYGTEFAAGADLCAAIEEDITIAPHETKLIPIGIAVEIPEGYSGLVYARSGLATKRNLAPANKVGVIDADYRGEIFVPLHNHGDVPQTIVCGERIAQMIVTPFLTAQFIPAEELSDTPRGDKGFGSTGSI
ncbi:MAG: dUTP diphosphatase [Oscillospiraceae bacterium]|nr:dUTP diphosphatase [Oscillospiraceae bacterium]